MIPGLAGLRALTQGDPEVCVAVLDGPVDREHPCFRGAALAQIETLAPGLADDRPATRHGTHVASILFGQAHGPVPGIAPRCRGLILPIFRSVGDHTFRSCSQLDLARALTQAVQHGAHLINVSGGEFSPSGTAYPLLADVVRDCARRGVLIIAAAGNDGCECLHVPAALDTVLAVGAMNVRGEPLAFTNWGGSYQSQAILAPGDNIPGAGPYATTAYASGTSYATAVVSGVAALLLSLQRRLGRRPDARRVRDALLGSALGCEHQPVSDCRRLLAGRLNVPGAVAFISSGQTSLQGTPVMPEPNEVQASGPAASPVITAPGPAETRPSGGTALAVQPSACACGGAAAGPRLVYALGQLGYDFPSEARLDSFAQHVAGRAGIAPARNVAFDQRQVLQHLAANPWDATSLEWVLYLDGMPIYAVRPSHAFTEETYELLRRFLDEQINQGAQRVAVPGVISGKASLLMGRTEVPVIIPEHRGLANWTTRALVDVLVGPAPAARAPAAERQQHERQVRDLTEHLQRIYHELRNLGEAPPDRALNYAASNAVGIMQAYQAALADHMDLDHFRIVRSPVGRPGSDCWDVEAYFFYPDREVQTVRRVYRFTVDVSDVVPVTIGEMRSWFTR